MSEGQGFVLHPQAAQDITDIWEFLAALDHAVLRVADAPARWPRYQGTARCSILQQFPCSLIYRITDDALDVIAVAHHRRRPGY